MGTLERLRALDSVASYVRRAAPLALVAGLVACGLSTEDASSAESASTGECESPLFQAVAQRVLDPAIAKNGTVDASLIRTTHNAADPHVYFEYPEIFAMFAKLITEAEHEVDMQFYMWQNDETPEERIVFQALKDLAARRASAGATSPVKVHILADSGVGELPFITNLAIRIAALELDPRYVIVQHAAYSHIDVGSLHSKGLIVDGKRAVVTGANIHDEDRHDAAFIVEGDVVRTMLADFDDAWRQGSVWTCPAAFAYPMHHGSSSRSCVAAGTVDRDFTPPVGPAACKPMLFVSRRGVNLANTFTNHVDNPQDQAFITALAGAKETVRLQSPNLNDDGAKAALFAALERGVTVEIVLSKGYEQLSESLPAQGGPNQPNVDELYDRLAASPSLHGADPCERLRIRWYAKDGQALDGNVPDAHHVKYLSVDGQLAITGSANMDTQSWNKSREINVVVGDKTTVEAWDKQLFERDFGNAVPVDRCAP